jgi:GNAT superfamily N-acetyltransferase
VSDVTVRVMRPDEAGAVGALTLTAYDASGRRIDGPYRDWLADPLRRIEHATAVLVAVDGDGVVLGTATFVLPGDREFEHPFHEGDAGFRMLAVDPAAQGRGVGALLIDACVERARAAGAHRIVITSMEWMTRAHAMYLRRGFVRRADLDVRFPPGRGCVFSHDLTDEAGTRFGPPGPEPDEVPWYEDVWDV